MRWNEEVTLITYEMHWTVRYFTHKSKVWSDVLSLPGTSLSPSDITSTSTQANAGALAYAKRKCSTWYQLAMKADRTFKIMNNAYKSLL
jgi:hypothetical protein